MSNIQKFSIFADMKKVLFLLLSVLLLAGCGSRQSMKITDPAERAAMRTRDESCSAKEAFSLKGLKLALNVVSQVKPKTLVADYKEALSLSTETKSLARTRGAFESVKQAKSSEYNPGLTLYCSLMLVAFVLIVLGKVIYALFHND